MKLLLIEDHLDIAENICEYVAGNGHQIEHVATG
jgi:DNA-binding response OmpR family regulator